MNNYKYLILLFLLSNSFEVKAVTPTLFVDQEINFGTISLSTGSCAMIPSTGALTSHIGQNVCILPKQAQKGQYTIVANPNKQIRVKVLPNLDNGAGYYFNPKIDIISDIQGKVLYNNTDYVEVNSGTSGVVTLHLGGELYINSILSSGLDINFSFVDAIEWEEL